MERVDQFRRNQAGGGVGENLTRKEDKKETHEKRSTLGGFRGPRPGEKLGFGSGQPRKGGESLTRGNFIGIGASLVVTKIGFWSEGEG